MDAGGQDATGRPPASAIPAAKLHVLGLAPLKSKLGPKWERLSVLVHRLFEKAIASAQSASDHCIVLDELSYAVTFNNLTLTETSLICASIAREVCEHLFGDQIDEVSVRTIIAEIVAPRGIGATDIGAQIEAMVEGRGVETVITHSVESGSPRPVVSVAENQPKPARSPTGQIQAAHSRFAQYGLRLGLLPIWELRKGLSSCVFLTSYSSDAAGAIPSGKLSHCGATEGQVLDLEVDQLTAASAYAGRIHEENGVCAVGVGVSYNSLSGFRSRIRYITALQKARFFPKNPLLLKIEQIPDGAPDGRLAELIAMLSLPNIRVTVEFQSLTAIPEIGVRLGAVGMGGTISPGMDEIAATAAAHKLATRAATHKIFAFLDHLDTKERVAVASRCNVRFGMGAALSRQPFGEFERLPRFPLKFTDMRVADRDDVTIVEV
jgi:hypothetical protein